MTTKQGENMASKKQVYEALREEFYNALPQTAHDCDVDIEEALCDKWSKEYDEFHAKTDEEFNEKDLTFG